MAQICAHCGSADTQALGNTFQCLRCGKQTDYEGRRRSGRGARMAEGEPVVDGDVAPDVDRDENPQFDVNKREDVPAVQPKPGGGTEESPADDTQGGDEFTQRGSLSS